MSRYDWQLVLTLTFDPTRFRFLHHRAPEKADKAFRRLILLINEPLYGHRWMAKSCSKGVIWVRAQESHQDGRLHYHALIHAPQKEVSKFLISGMSIWWERHYGMARLEPVRCADDVLRYLTKHVATPEAVEIDLSNNF